MEPNPSLSDIQTTLMEARIDRHKQEWSHCTSCLLHRNATRRVFGKGCLPCDYLLVGEAPGESENVLGLPFVGPSGSLLDDLLAQAAKSLDLTRATTNIVACIPLQKDDCSSGRLREPTQAEALACRPRLMEFIRLAKPRLVITLGRTAQKYFPYASHLFPTLSLIHPAAILYQEEHAQRLTIRRFILALKRALRKVAQEKEQ